MDEQRFDSLARMVAGSGSRRGILRGLAGAITLLAARQTAPAALAHHGRLGPGDPCRTDSQCVGADAPLVCAYNGFDYDGSLNCCTYEGSRCGFDQACCGDAMCLNGFCSSQPVYSGPGDPCFDSSQCLGADAPLTCDFVAHTGDYRCCAYEGSRCGFDAACCGTAICSGGRCSNTLEFAGPGDLCGDGFQCVAADTAVTCDFNGYTNDLRCCAYEGGRCGWSGGCCGWLRCGNDGFCTS